MGIALAAGTGALAVLVFALWIVALCKSAASGDFRASEMFEEMRRNG